MKKHKKPEQWLIPDMTKVEINGVKYQYFSGCWRTDGKVLLSSRERGVQLGETRGINGKLFYAHSIAKRGPFERPSIDWYQIHNENT